MKTGKQRFMKIICMFTLTVFVFVGHAELASAAVANISKAKFPAWYSFPEYAMNFENPIDDVSPQFYFDMYGLMKGSVLYSIYEDEEFHALCYGMAIANASMFAGRPVVSSYFSAYDYYYDNINELNPGSLSDDSWLPLLSFIKYAYIYQASSSTSAAFENNVDDIDGLHKAVGNFVYSGGEPVIIGLLSENFAHEVLAVGLIGDDIVICDSNDPTALYLMDFTGDTWKYECGGLKWNSSDSWFDYSTDVFTVYNNIINGDDSRYTYVDDYVYSVYEELTGDSDVYATGMVKVDEDKQVVLFADEFENLLDEFYAIGYYPTFFSDGYDPMYVAWMNNGDKMFGVNTSEYSKEIMSFGNSSGIKAWVPGGAYAAIDDNELYINCDPGDTVSFEFYGPNSELGLSKCNISGTANGNAVAASLCEAGISYYGLNNVTVTVTDLTDDVYGTYHFSSADDVLLLWSSEDVYAECRFLKRQRGDIDGDGTVSSSDARIVLRCSVKLDNVMAYGTAICDFDRDGEITSSDARYVLRSSVGLTDF